MEKAIKAWQEAHDKDQTVKAIGTLLPGDRSVDDIGEKEVQLLVDFKTSLVAKMSGASVADVREQFQAPEQLDSEDEVQQFIRAKVIKKNADKKEQAKVGCTQTTLRATATGRIRTQTADFHC